MADEVLTLDEKKKLDDNSKIVSDFKQNKLEKEAQKNWDLFYKRNSTNFFKDRHWTTAEFKELLFDRSEVSIYILAKQKLCLYQGTHMYDEGSVSAS